MTNELPQLTSRPDTIKVHLNVSQIASLVAGVCPAYSLFTKYRRYGRFHGGFNNHWEWNKYDLCKLGALPLWSFYQDLLVDNLKAREDA
jgi:hypothetical protein